MSVSNEFFYNNTTLAGEAIFFDPIKIGCGAGDVSQGENSVALGTGAGYSNQGARSVSIGFGAAGTKQGSDATSIGNNAGRVFQGTNAVAIGSLASSGLFAQTLAGTILHNIFITTSSADIFCPGMHLYLEGADLGTSIISRLTNDSEGNARYSVESTEDILIPSVIVGIAGGQSANAVAIGSSSASVSQGIDAVAVGHNTGYLNQEDYAIAIGSSAAQHGQGTSSIAIGHNAAASQLSQTVNGTIINNIFTAELPTAEFAVGMKLYYDAINLDTTIIERLANDFLGHHRYLVTTVSDITSPIPIIGRMGTQQSNAISIGTSAGQRFQDHNAIAIGTSAGTAVQGNAAIAIGASAGAYNQGSNSIAIGNSAGTGQLVDTLLGTIVDDVFTAVSPSAIFVSGMLLYTSNNTYLGTSIVSRLSDLNENHRYSVTPIADITVPIYIAGIIRQENNTIILNASGLPLDGVAAQPESTYIAPIRVAPATPTALFYNNTTKEVTSGFPCLPSYAGDVDATAAITALGATLAEGMMYIDTSNPTGHVLKLYINGMWVIK